MKFLASYPAVGSSLPAGGLRVSCHNLLEVTVSSLEHGVFSRLFPVRVRSGRVTTTVDGTGNAEGGPIRHAGTYVSPGTCS